MNKKVVISVFIIGIVAAIVGLFLLLERQQIKPLQQEEAQQAEVAGQIERFTTANNILSNLETKNTRIVYQHDDWRVVTTEFYRPGQSTVAYNGKFVLRGETVVLASGTHVDAEELAALQIPPQVMEKFHEA